MSRLKPTINTHKTMFDLNTVHILAIYYPHHLSWRLKEQRVWRGTVSIIHSAPALSIATIENKICPSYAQCEHRIRLTKVTGFTDWSFFSDPSDNVWDSSFRKNMTASLYILFDSSQRSYNILPHNQSHWKVSLYKLGSSWPVNVSHSK